MAVQLILYPQVYDGYYSYQGVNSTSGGASNSGPTGPALLTPTLGNQLVGNAVFNNGIVGTPNNLGSPTGIIADNNINLINRPAAIGTWRLSYTNDLAGDLPRLSNGNLRLSGSATAGSTSIAYNTVNGLQAGNSYRVLITIESGPAAELTIGSTGSRTWLQKENYNGSRRMAQLGGANGPLEGRNDFINARTGANIGQPLRTAITTTTRVYQNFIATGPTEVIQVNFQSLGSTTPLVISSVSVQPSPTNYPNNNQAGITPALTGAQANVQTYLDDGQVILDLYKDETIPLNLSVDNFTKVDEKIASYSKSFMIPATKHNNKIFSFYFDVTRSQAHDVFFFNPFAKTRAKIKDDTVLIFEGWLKLINVQEKNGQISYNVNLYSEPTTFCDYLKAGTISDLDLTELAHDYDGTTIPDSWDPTIGLPLTAPLLTTSYAYDAALGVNNTNALKYPFINWAGAFEVTSPTRLNVGMPENVFRPTINCKYLLDRMFEVTPFSYTSNFLSSPYFKKLYMDMNFSGDAALMSTFFTMSNNQETGGPASTGAPGNWEALALPIMNTEQPVGSAYTWYNPISGRLTMQYVAASVMLYGQPRFKRTHYNDVGEWRYVKTDAGGVDTVLITGSIAFNIFSNCPTGTGLISNIDDQCRAGRMSGSTWQIYTLQQNETIRTEYRMVSGSGSVTPTTNANINNWDPDFAVDSYNNEERNGQAYQIFGGVANINFLMQGLRGQMKQYDFWNGLKQMFNLVTMPDPVNQNRLIIEPYADIFLTNPDSKQLDWTNKIDLNNIKHQPLNKIPKATVFTYKEDKSDYRVTQYKNALGGYLYGSKTYEAGDQFFSLLTGEKKIVASPFAPTIAAPLTMLHPDFICSHIYKAAEEGQFSPFENAPRILYDEGLKAMPPGIDYRVAFFFGFAQSFYTTYGRMTHLEQSDPTVSTTKDLNFGECPLVQPIGSSPTDNLFNTYWLPYYEALYNPDCRSLKIKMKLDPKDINEFNFYDTILIRNREYRVNKIQYNSGVLATVELILIP